MANSSCTHESDVLDLVVMGQWPARADDQLRTHVAGCPVCADIPLVARAIADLRDDAAHVVVVPDASIVWLKSQMRARQEATRLAARPLWIAQLAATVVVAGLIWAGFAASHPMAALSAVKAWFTSMGSLSAFDSGTLFANAWTVLRWGGLAMLSVAVLVSLALSVSSLADRTSDLPDKGHGR